MVQSNEKKIIHIHLPKQNYKTVMTAGNHELVADEPDHMGGTDSGPDPYDYQLSFPISFPISNSTTILPGRFMIWGSLRQPKFRLKPYRPPWKDAM